MIFRTLLSVVFLVGVLVWVPLKVNAEGITQEQADAILTELTQIRQLLEKMQQQGGMQPAPSAAQNVRARASTRNRPVLGADDAPVTLVEFTDYQCPFCSQFFLASLPGIKEEYIDTGKVRLVIKDLPLTMHPQARAAAVAARCAGEQDQYWAMHDNLFKNTRQLYDQQLKQYAQDIGLDTKRFQECLSSDRHSSTIDAEIAEANRQGVTGTPTFIVGRTTDDVVEGVRLRGVQTVETLRPYFDALLQTLEDPSG